MILKILLVIIGVFLGLVGSGFCQSAKARDTITMTLEDYEHMGEILHSLPIRERHKSLKGKDVAYELSLSSDQEFFDKYAEAHKKKFGTTWEPDRE